MLYAGGIFLHLSSIVSLIKKKDYRRLTLFSMIILFVLSALRYSNGADYYSYALIFETIPREINLALSSTIHSDPGFNVLIALVKQLGLNYRGFLIILAIMTLYGFLKPITQKSTFPLISLTIFYSVYYHIYVNSAVRQGLAMAMIFYAIIYFYNKGEHWKFIGVIFLASTFHFSALVMLSIYPINYLARNKTIVNFALIASLVLILLANATSYIDIIINYFLNLVGYSVYADGQVNILSILTKISLLVFISILYFISSKHKTEEDKFYYRLYVIGILIYLFFINYPMVARVLDYFTMFEILLIPSLLIKTKDIPLRIASVVLTIIILSVIMFKDFYSFTFQESYYNNGLFDYQYISILDKEKELEVKSMHSLKILLPQEYY